MNKKKPVIIQKPIGIVMTPYVSTGTGDYIPTIYGMKGLREKSDVTTIAVYNQYVGVPMLLIYTVSK